MSKWHFNGAKGAFQTWQLGLLHALQRLGLSRGNSVSGGGKSRAREESTADEWSVSK